METSKKKYYKRVMKVMKFGGSCLIDAGTIERITGIILREREKQEIIVVLSAMKGITDKIILSARQAEKGDQSYRTTLDEIIELHTRTIAGLFAPDAEDAVLEVINILFDELRDILHGLELVKECSPRSMDLIMSFGERLSCSLVAAYLSTSGVRAEMIDARKLITTNAKHGNAAVDFVRSYSLIKTRFKTLETTPVVTGFIASTPENVTTTLGRNGSDFTASILAAGAGAETVEIWTDVDGVMSADPRLVDEAFVISEMSAEEAMELSFFGAEVIHPRTMIPAIEKQIPIIIKNALNPEAEGTLISKEGSDQKRLITGIASIKNIALINIQGGGMVGIPGIASRIFSSLAQAGVNIILISQASSEHSICIACREEELGPAIEGLNTELESEIETKSIEPFEGKTGMEIVAVIGENMRGTPGLAGRLFSALGEAGINIYTIAQGSSERNISFVIDNAEKVKTLKTIHKAFFGAGGADL
jgi:bifunctional aspartokinase / homoserine dehydrogenase 1